LRQKLLALVLALALGTTSDNANAQEDESLELDVGAGAPIKLLRVNHDALDIEIDGRIDETVWQRIQPIGEMKVTKPDSLTDVPYQTDVRIFYTEIGIYLSFDLEQPADTIIERFVARDEMHVSRDWVGFTLDTSGDGRYGYWMIVSLRQPDGWHHPAGTAIWLDLGWCLVWCDPANRKRLGRRVPCALVTDGNAKIRICSPHRNTNHSRGCTSRGGVGLAGTDGDSTTIYQSFPASRA